MPSFPPYLYVDHKDGRLVAQGQGVTVFVSQGVDPWGRPEWYGSWEDPRFHERRESHARTHRELVARLRRQIPQAFEEARLEREERRQMPRRTSMLARAAIRVVRHLREEVRR